MTWFADWSGLILLFGTGISFFESTSTQRYYGASIGLFDAALMWFLSFCACDMLWLCLFWLPYLLDV